MKIPFCGATYQGRSVDAVSSRAVNLFPEATAVQGDKSDLIMIGTPGTLLFSRVNESGDTTRALYSFDGELFALAGDTLYSIATDGDPTLIDTIGTSTGRVSIADNGLASGGVGGDQMIIVDGDTGYIYDAGTGNLTEITDADFIANPTHVTYIDGYFVVSNDSMQFAVSNLYDGTAWNALATAAVSSFPDNIQTHIAHNNQLFFIKEFTSEAWYDAGVPTTTGSPFLRSSGAVFDYGTPSPWSVAKGGNSIFFVASNRVNNKGTLLGVVQITAYEPTLISPPPISYKVSQSTDLSTLFGYCYIEQGHMFYVLTNPTDDWTLVYDTSTQMWHEWSSFDDGVTPNRHVSNCYAHHLGEHYVGDFRNALVLKMGINYMSDNGVPINSWRTAPHIYDPDELMNVFISSLDVDIEPGVGLDTTVVILLAYPADGTWTANGEITAGGVLQSTANPIAYLSWSNDGGHTYSSEYPCAMGQENQFTARLRWRRLGYARSRVWKLRISEPVKKVILGAYITAGK